jgi:signal transduction histidine kinase
LTVERTPPSRPAASVALNLRLAFGALLVFLLLAGTVGAVGLTTQTRSANRLLYRTGPLMTETQLAQQALTDAETSVRGYIITGEDNFLSLYTKGSTLFHQHLDAADALLGPDSAAADDIAAMRLTGDRWLVDFAAPAVEARRAGRPGPFQNEGKALFDSFRSAAERSGNVLEAERDTGRIAISDQATAGRSALFLAMGLGTLFGALVAIRTSRRIVGPLERLKATLTELGRGDEGARAALEGPAEIQAVAVTLNELAAENAALSASEREQADRERTIRQIATRIRQHLDVGAVLDQAVTEVRQAVGGQRVVIRLLAGDDMQPPVASWTAEGFDVPDLPALPVASGSAAVPSGTVGVDDVDADEVREQHWLGFLRAFGVKSMLLTPILAGSAPQGVLIVAELSGPRHWSESDVAVLEAVARELGGALSHAQAYERERHMVGKLQELDNVKTEFVSSVSHELRTPLTSIVGYLELLNDGAAGQLDPEQTRMLDVIERNSRRLLSLIEDLLTLSRIESGAFKVSLAEVELPPLVEGVVESIRPNLDRHEIKLEVELAERLGMVRGDAAQLERVLTNLLTNAVKFTPGGGRVTLTARPVGKTVAISVSDTGIGIPLHEQPKLFSRFFRSSTAQEQAIQGTGLGLVIVKSIVEHHGGTIWFTSKPGTGTTFTVTLPLADRGPERTPVPVSASVSAGRGARGGAIDDGGGA